MTQLADRLPGPELTSVGGFVMPFSFEEVMAAIEVSTERLSRAGAKVRGIMEPAGEIEVPNCDPS